MKYFIYIYLTLLAFDINGQHIFEQNIVMGGVTGAGFSTGQGAGSGTFEIYIEPGSTIKKAYLLTYRIGYPPSAEFILNNDTIVFDTINEISSFNHKSVFASPMKIYFFDYTSKINPITNTYNVTIPLQLNLPINWGYWTLQMYVIYENQNLPEINTTIIINNQNLLGNEVYNIANLNGIDYNHPVGLALYTDRTGSQQKKNSNLFINSNLIGITGGSDQVNSLWSFAGVKGHFYYQNNQLFGLDDDIPNNTMDSTDGLADIKDYINGNSFNFRLTHVDYPTNQPQHTNVNLAYFLSYTTPCDTFSVNTPDLIQVCKGDSVQINVSGGSTYEWEATNASALSALSCTNCPNPYFTDTVSRWYTVRVWNNDSCSKVLPVRVEVVPKPLNPIVQTSPTKCSDSSGVATVQLIESSYLYALDNGAFQSNAVFSGLSAGNHHISVIDTNGCVAETNFSISETFPTAKFTASPLEGDVPLDVNFTNQSTGATDFIWYIANDTLYSVNPNYTFEEEGNFNVTLVAYDTYLHCSDTASVQIFATFPFTVIAPSLFVKQDVPYQIYTSNVASLSYVLYNSIGQQLYNHTLHPTQGLNDVWYPYNISRGIYLYRITAQDDEGNEKVFSGKIVVI